MLGMMAPHNRPPTAARGDRRGVVERARHRHVRARAVLPHSHYSPNFARSVRQGRLRRTYHHRSIAPSEGDQRSGVDGWHTRGSDPLIRCRITSGVAVQVSRFSGIPGTNLRTPSTFVGGNSDQRASQAEGREFESRLPLHPFRIRARPFAGRRPCRVVDHLLSRQRVYGILPSTATGPGPRGLRSRVACHGSRPRRRPDCQSVAEYVRLAGRAE